MSKNHDLSQGLNSMYLSEPRANYTIIFLGFVAQAQILSYKDSRLLSNCNSSIVRIRPNVSWSNAAICIQCVRKVIRRKGFKGMYLRPSNLAFHIRLTWSLLHHHLFLASSRMYRPAKLMILGHNNERYNHTECQVVDTFSL